MVENSARNGRTIIQLTTIDYHLDCHHLNKVTLM